MLRHAKGLLQLCTERFPSPRPSQNHALLVIDGVMVLTLMQGDTYARFNLDDSDLDRTPDDIVEDVASMLASAPTLPPAGPIAAVPPQGADEPA